MTMFISKYRQAIRFKFLALTLFTVLTRCANPVDDGAAGGRFTFTVANVGQGLAQFGVVGKRAVAWDIGEQFPAWYSAYVNLGSPHIESIIISHTHTDHYGALQSIIKSLDWSGEIVVSPYEDTAKLREYATAWKDRITFKHCTRGDTLRPLGAAVAVVCVWPPSGLNIEAPIPDNQKNHCSLAFSVRHGSARALITSDIDSAAMEEIAAQSRYDLRAQILSVPHHGSAGSVNKLFFSYVGSETAVISCSSNNTYGHPSPKMIDALMYQAGRIMYTYIDGTVTFGSNRFYWSFGGS
jgi:competence protein ComEC